MIIILIPKNQFKKIKNIKIQIDPNNVFELRNVERGKVPNKNKYTYVGRLYVNNKRGTEVIITNTNIDEVKKELRNNFKKYKHKWD